MSNMFPPQRPKSFDDAVRIYNEIKPIKGKNAHLDIRPLGRRGNHAERIIKIDDNTYALWCSSHWWMDKVALLDLSEVRIRASVLWERTAEGDFVHVRNDWRNSGHVSAYRFLWQTLPHDLSFVTQNGKQYVAHYVDSKRVYHYLPHDTWMGGSYANGEYTSPEDQGPLTPELVFKHEGREKFTLVSGGFTAPKKVVDKDTKAELKDSIKAFKAWALLMAPMLNIKPTWSWPYTDADSALNEAWVAQRRTDNDVAAKWASENGYGKLSVNLLVQVPKLTRQIVQSDQHPMRVILASYTLNMCNLRQIEYDVLSDKLSAGEGRAKFNNAFNYHMNQILGLVEEK